jgi:hypothetical protein
MKLDADTDVIGIYFYYVTNGLFNQNVSLSF